MAAPWKRSKRNRQYFRNDDIYLSWRINCSSIIQIDANIRFSNYDQLPVCFFFNV